MTFQRITAKAADLRAFPSLRAGAAIPLALLLAGCQQPLFNEPTISPPSGSTLPSGQTEFTAEFPYSLSGFFAWGGRIVAEGIQDGKEVLPEVDANTLPLSLSPVPNGNLKASSKWTLAVSPGATQSAFDLAFKIRDGSGKLVKEVAASYVVTR